MTRTAWRVGRIVLGVLFLFLGVIGLFLPFLQGILFLVIGLSFLSNESIYARRSMEWLRSRIPHRHRGWLPGDHPNG